MIIIDLNYLKEKVAKKIFDNGYSALVRESPGSPESGFGHLIQFIVDSKDLTGGIDFWSFGQIEMDLWSIKSKSDVIGRIFFDSYKLPEAQEKLKEFIHHLLPDFKFEDNDNVELPG